MNSDLTNAGAIRARLLVAALGRYGDAHREEIKRFIESFDVEEDFDEATFWRELALFLN